MQLVIWLFLLWPCCNAEISESDLTPPSIISGPKVEEVGVGSFVEFFCHANGNPPPAVTWSFGGKKIQNKSRDFVQTAYSLRIPKVKASLQGIYCCYANNGHKIKDQMCGSLFVMNAPTSKISPSGVTTVVGSTFGLSCIVSGRPMPNFKWYHNKSAVDCQTRKSQLQCKDTKQIKGGMLLAQNVSHHHAGSYQCGVWNVVGQSLSESVTVQVLNTSTLFLKKDTRNVSTTESVAELTLQGNTGVVFTVEKTTSFGFPLIVLNVLGACIVVTLFLVILFYCQKYNERSQPSASSITHQNEISVLNHIAYHSNDNQKIPCDCAEVTSLEYPWLNLQFVAPVGKGKFGAVFKAVAPHLCKKEKMVVAVKTLLSVDDVNLKILYNEAKILHSFCHPNIVSLLGVCFQYEKPEGNKQFYPIPPFLLFEFVDGCDVHAFLGNLDLTSTIDEVVISKIIAHLQTDVKTNEECLLLVQLKICYDIASAMCYLAQQGFIHRDLATRNCLISSSQGVVKVGDFGLSRKLHDSDYYKSCGEESMPVRWMAPECLLYGQYTTKTDVWSFAVTMWEIFMCSEQPYHGLQNDKVIKNIIEGITLSKPELAPVWVYNLMRLCWSEPIDRPSFEAIFCLLSKSLNNHGKLSV